MLTLSVYNNQSRKIFLNPEAQIQHKRQNIETYSKTTINVSNPERNSCWNYTTDAANNPKDIKKIENHGPVNNQSVFNSIPNLSNQIIFEENLENVKTAKLNNNPSTRRKYKKF